MKLWTLALAVTLALMGVNAEAKRLGGGTSVGKQSSNVTQRQAAPAAPAAPTQNAATAPKPAPAAAPAAAPKRPWGAMLGGLAAGLGLAWLAHSLGMGEAFGQFMLIGLVVLLAMMAFGWFMRNRRPAASSAGPYAFQGAGAGEAVAPSPAYRPENVGNDASARPWERNTASFDATGAQASPGIVIGSALAGSQAWGVPAGFDAEGFLKAAKTNFATLQAAWDRSDLGTLRSMMTDEMLAEIRQQLTEREAHTGGPANQTDVVMLEAQLLGIEDLGDTYMASVEFSGMIREEPSAGPSPFREVWNMTKSKTGASGWLVAGVQALQ
ncbi:MAG: Tim44 domain-containing protein [Burkholderiales bacterium]|nr:Tim44 domain-containing protein [Burkholderiales bacterium]